MPVDDRNRHLRDMSDFFGSRTSRHKNDDCEYGKRRKNRKAYFFKLFTPAGHADQPQEDAKSNSKNRDVVDQQMNMRPVHNLLLPISAFFGCVAWLSPPMRLIAQLRLYSLPPERGKLPKENIKFCLALFFLKFPKRNPACHRLKCRSRPLPDTTKTSVWLALRNFLRGCNTFNPGA